MKNSVDIIYQTDVKPFDCFHCIQSLNHIAKKHKTTLGKKKSWEYRALSTVRIQPPKIK
jgi:hypothetical protein